MTLGSSKALGCDLGPILCVLEVFWEGFDPANLVKAFEPPTLFSTTYKRRTEKKGLPAEMDDRFLARLS